MTYNKRLPMVLKHRLWNHLSAQEREEVKHVTARLVYKDGALPDNKAIREWALLRRRLSAKYGVNEDLW